MERLPIPSCKQNLCRLHEPFFYGSGTDVYGWLRMVTECGTQTVEQVPAVLLAVQRESFSPGSNALHHTRTVRMPQV